MNGLRVTAKTAGMESTAKSRSVVSTISSTRASGVSAFRPSHGHELLPVQLRRDGIELAHPLDDAVVLRMHFGLDEEHPEAAVEEEGAEDVEDPIHQGDEGDAQADHQAAHDQRAQNAPVEDAMLVFPRGRGNRRR